MGPSRYTVHVHKNRAHHDATSAVYEAQHAHALAAHDGMAWGDWRRSETELHVLGDVAGRDILELGCGAARWCIGLAHRGARPVGLDVSSVQLALARTLQAEAALTFPLIEASAEDVPLPDASFDIVFGDWGAMSFCDPSRTVPEVARLLRPGGLFAFCGGTPWLTVCEDPATGELRRRLARDYFGLSRQDWPDDTQFQMPYGAWIRLFVQSGLVVEDLIELAPLPGATSTYFDARVTAWARRWPLEHIWKVRKPAR